MTPTPDCPILSTPVSSGHYPSDFKSLVSDVNDVEEMSDHMYPALSYQYMFNRKTSPWEMEDWDYEELQNFQVDLDDVDRLYYLHCTNDGISGSTFHLLARVIHKNNPGKRLFVELVASCDYTGFDCQGGGEIFITASPNIFYQVILREDYNRKGLYTSLVEDGYQIEDHTQYNSCSRFDTNLNAPMLKFLCHASINDNKTQLQHYPTVLPKMLKESIDEFIQVRESIEAYDN